MAAKIKSAFFELFKSDRKIKIITVLLVAAGILILLSCYFPQNKKTNEKIKTFSTEEYEKGVEKKIEDMVFSLTGAKASVSVTLSSSKENIYLDETKKENGKSEENYIVVKDSSGAETALLVTEKMPEIRGVVVITNGISAEGCLKIKQSVLALLNISEEKVCVLSS